MERVQNLLEYNTGTYKRYQFLCIFSSIILKIFLLDPDPGGKMNADPDPQPWLAGCQPIYGVVSVAGSDYSGFFFFTAPEPTSYFWGNLNLPFHVIYFFSRLL